MEQGVSAWPRAVVIAHAMHVRVLDAPECMLCPTQCVPLPLPLPLPLPRPWTPWPPCAPWPTSWRCCSPSACRWVGVLTACDVSCFTVRQGAGQGGPSRQAKRAASPRSSSLLQGQGYRYLHANPGKCVFFFMGERAGVIICTSREVCVKSGWHHLLPNACTEVLRLRAGGGRQC